MPEKRISKGRITNQSILKAARDCFLERGFHATGMREVSQRAGITLGAIYNHHASKEDLWKEVFRMGNPTAIMMKALNEAEGETPETLLRDVAGRVSTSLRNEPELLRLLLIELLEFNGVNLMYVIRENAAVVLEFEKKCLSLGDSLRPLPPFLLTRSFLGLLASWFMAETFFSGNLPDSLACLGLDEAMDIYLNGVLRHPAQNI